MIRITFRSSLNNPNTWWKMFHIVATKQMCILNEYAGGLVFDIVNATSLSAGRSEVLSLGQCNDINIISDSQM